MPFGSFNIRFMKQLGYFLGMGAAAISTPLILGISLETFIGMACAIAVGEIATYVMNFSNQRNFPHVKLCIVALEILFSEFGQGLKWNFAVGILMNRHKIIKSILEKPQIHFGMGMDDMFELEPQVKNLGEALSKKAELKNVKFQISNLYSVNASASIFKNKVKVCRKLIEVAQNNHTLYRSVFSHEIGHLDRTIFDSVFLNLKPYFYSLLLSGSWAALFQDFEKLYMSEGFVQDNIFGSFKLMTTKLAVLYFAYVSANIFDRLISQMEEERADRYACHLVEPEEALEGMKFFFELDDVEKNVAQNRMQTEAKSLPMYKRFLNKLPSFSNPLNISTHPSHQYRLNSMEDEINKIKKIPLYFCSKRLC